MGGLLLLGCLFICCCYVRRQAAKKAEESSRVKKYQVKDEDKLSKFKYGRQSAPIQLPELADNGDEMHKPDDYSAYKQEGDDNGQYDDGDGLEF